MACDIISHTSHKYTEIRDLFTPTPHPHPHPPGQYGRISVKCIPRSPVDNKPALLQVMAWRRTGDKTSPDDPVQWLIYAALRGDELKLTSFKVTLIFDIKINTYLEPYQVFNYQLWEAVFGFAICYIIYTRLVITMIISIHLKHFCSAHTHRFAYAPKLRYSIE